VPIVEPVFPPRFEAIPEPLPDPYASLDAEEAEAVPRAVPPVVSEAVPDQSWAEPSGPQPSANAYYDDEQPDPSDQVAATEMPEFDTQPPRTYSSREIEGDPDATVIPGSEDTRETNLGNLVGMMEVDILEEANELQDELGARTLEPTDLENLAVHEVPAVDLDLEESTTVAAPASRPATPIPGVRPPPIPDLLDSEEPLDMNDLGIEVELEDDISAAERAEHKLRGKPVDPTPPPEEPKPRRPSGFFKKLFGK
jgi:hypothetical protein